MDANAAAIIEAVRDLSLLAGGGGERPAETAASNDNGHAAAAAAAAGTAHEAAAAAKAAAAAAAAAAAGDTPHHAAPVSSSSSSGGSSPSHGRSRCASLDSSSARTSVDAHHHRHHGGGGGGGGVASSASNASSSGAHVLPRPGTLQYYPASSAACSSSAAAAAASACCCGVGCSLDCSAAAAATGNTPTAAQAAACAPRPFAPHDGYALGCPDPPCVGERVATARAIHQSLDLQDSTIESTLRLLCKVFEVETSTVSLLTGERIFLVGACGALPVCVCPDRWGFCGWSFLNANHELNVVEDMSKDARFSDNFFVVSPDFNLQFYVMAPLLSANGHRVGTLCIMGSEPRKFDATRGAILANLSELLVRQIERRWALQDLSRHTGSKLLRAADAYDAATAFVDASNPLDWRVLHLNTPAAKLLGVDWRVTYDELPRRSEGRGVQPFSGVALTDLLDVDVTRAVWAEGAVELRLPNVRGARGTAARKRRFDLSLRLAAAEALDEYAPFSVGIPSWLREAGDPAPGSNYFFLHVRPAAAAAEQEAAQGGAGAGGEPQQQQALLPPGGQASALVRQPGVHGVGPRRYAARSPIPNLVLGPLLGRGGFGRVYRGVHEGREVAVKIIERLESVRVTPDGTPIEVALTQNMHHLGVLRSFAWGVSQPAAAAAATAAGAEGAGAAAAAAAAGAPRYAPSSSAELPSCWIVMEYADKHTLVDAVVKGWFRTSRHPTRGGTHLRTVALTAYEVASALSYIHSHGVLHLDLTSGNVLLKTFAGNPHGFAARVTDFGLSRCHDPRVRTAPGRYGTISHMAPETIRAGVLAPSCDVYAWGVCLWEMLTGSRAWAGLTHAQVLLAAGGDEQQLQTPPGLEGRHAVLRRLLEGALRKDPAARPGWQEVLPALERYLQETRDCGEAELELPLRSTAE